jgi:ABC-type phosphate/phosphonate transport system substrate-binding protein
MLLVTLCAGVSSFKSTAQAVINILRSAETIQQLNISALPSQSGALVTRNLQPVTYIPTSQAVT